MASLGRRVLQVRGAAAAASLMRGGRPHAGGSMVLCYHDISDRASTAYQVSPQRFRDQLNWLKEWGIRFVTLKELVDDLFSGACPGDTASIVFDDALVGVHRHALETLSNLGIPSSIFVVTSRMGEEPRWWGGANRTMSESELRDAIAAGCTLESHTYSHRSLPSLSPADLEEELRTPREFLSDRLGQPAAFIAYPSGHYNQAVLTAAARAGYRAGFSFLNGRVTPGLDPYRLPRFTMWQGLSKARLAYHVSRSERSWGDTQPPEVVGPTGREK